MSRGSGVTLKVDRQKLIGKLETTREKMHLNYIANIQKYDAEVEKKTKTAIKRLQAKLDKGDIEFGYNDVKVRIHGKDVVLNTQKPSKPKFDEIDTQLMKLKLSVDEQITVSDRSDYFKYLTQ
jgi:hypothetical protein